MYELPLFPLNTVLFPGVPIFLHIFEDRYKQMINLCINERRPFGVVLISQGVEANGPAEPHAVGCTAEIVQVQRLDDGRMDIVAVGQERFRILSTHSRKPYLQGLVEAYPLVTDAPEAVLAADGRELRALFEQYVNILRRVGEVRIDWDRLPETPVDLAYLAAYVLQVPPTEKQEILAQAQASGLLAQLRRAFTLEVAVMRQMPPDDTPFSLN